MTVRLGLWQCPAALVLRSQARPRDLLIDSSGSGLIARAGHVVKAPAAVLRILAALFCGRRLSRFEIVDLLYAEDPLGGPESADKIIEKDIQAARLAGAALGFRIDVETGLGWSARLVDLGVRP